MKTTANLKSVFKNWLNIYCENLIINFSWFQADPAAQEQFRKFRGITIEEIQALPRVKAHGLHIFGAIDNIVRSLDEEEVAKELIIDLERDHRGRTSTLKRRDYRV